MFYNLLTLTFPVDWESSSISLRQPPREKGMIYRETAFLRSYDLAPRPSPPTPLSRQQALPATHRNTEKERQLSEKRGGRRGRRGAKSYNHKKAWPFINH